MCKANNKATEIEPTTYDNKSSTIFAILVVQIWTIEIKNGNIKTLPVLFFEEKIDYQTLLYKNTRFKATT